MPEPLAALDPSGIATVISYDVPEPTSYSGRNFLEIPLPPMAFTTVVVDPSTVVPALAAAGGSPARPITASLVTSPAVVTAAGAADSSPILQSPRPLSDRLAALTNADVAAVAASGQRVVVHQNIAGQHDFRVVAALRPEGGGGPDTSPTVFVFISNPANGASMHGSAAGVTFTVSGTWGAADTHDVALVLWVDAEAPTVIPRQRDVWSARMTINAAGSHTINARISATGYSSALHREVVVHDEASCVVVVTLDRADPSPAPVLPGLQFASPPDNTTVVSPGGLATVTVAGTATCAADARISRVQVTDELMGTTVAAAGPDLSAWSVELLLSGVGRHRLTVVATDDKGRSSPPQSVGVSVSAEQPFRRLKSRLLIVETLNLSSFLGAFGAGRVIKTFSLLPGERTTISVKSWRKSSETRKQASSIVDSDATESAEDFEDTLNTEHTDRETQSESSSYRIGATAGATWGWGSASITAEVSGSANSARDEAVRSINAATRKHSMKASSNRTITIDTEYTAAHEDGTEDSTVREIANINVSRTLNFIFRQMNQEHITLVHLTNARIAFYTEDLMLDADGNPAYVDDPHSDGRVLDIRSRYDEVHLSRLQHLLDSAISPAWHPKVLDAITFALSGIPDHTDELRTVFEWVEPTKDGTAVEGAAYMRFPRNLKTVVRDQASGKEITVPGIVLAQDRIVMRTEGVMVDTVLGHGDGLDAYSHGLQDVAVDERRVAVAERRAALDRLALARQVVADKDKAAAEVFALVFPAPAVAVKD